MEKTFGEQVDALVEFATHWNAITSAPERYKNGAVKRKRKKPIDALAYVRTPQQERLVWDSETKYRAILKLQEEEERRAREDRGFAGDD